MSIHEIKTTSLVVFLPLAGDQAAALTGGWMAQYGKEGTSASVKI